MTYPDRSVAYAYSPAGDLTAKTTTWADGSPDLLEEFDYDTLGRMRRYTRGDPRIPIREDVEILTDFQGNRVQTTDQAGTWRKFLYSGEDILYTERYTNTWSYQENHFLHGPGIDEPLASFTIYQGSPTGVISLREYFIHADALGSVKGIYYPWYDALSPLDYDAWGNVAYDPDQIGTGWGYGYTGREFFGEGYYYYRARYYEPSTGRIMQVDPVGVNGGINHYIYKWMANSRKISSSKHNFLIILLPSQLRVRQRDSASSIKCSSRSIQPIITCSSAISLLNSLIPIMLTMISNLKE